MSNKAIRSITEDRNYWKKLCSKLSDENIQLDERAQDNDQAIVDLNKHVEDLEDENADLKKQNKIYREAIENALTEGEFEDVHTQLERIVTTLNVALEESK